MSTPLPSCVSCGHLSVHMSVHMSAHMSVLIISLIVIKSRSTVCDLYKLNLKAVVAIQITVQTHRTRYTGPGIPYCALRTRHTVQAYSPGTHSHVHLSSARSEHPDLYSTFLLTNKRGDKPEISQQDELMIVSSCVREYQREMKEEKMAAGDTRWRRSRQGGAGGAGCRWEEDG